MADFDAVQLIPDTVYNHVSGTNDAHGAQDLLGNSGSGGSFVYYMRGYDTTLVSLVYWVATILDSTGSQYPGPGPLINILLLRKV